MNSVAHFSAHIKTPSRRSCRAESKRSRRTPRATSDNLINSGMTDYWLYILTNLPRRTVLSIDMSNSLEIHLAQHRNGVARGFAWQNNTNALLYYEKFPEPSMAIEEENN